MCLSFNKQELKFNLVPDCSRTEGEGTECGERPGGDGLETGDDGQDEKRGRRKLVLLRVQLHEQG